MWLVRLVVRLAMVIFTTVVALALMALAFVTLAVVIGWSLLRGRKPAVDLSGLRRARRHMGGEDVMDVEAREIPEPTPRITSSSRD